jgi:hypothetical protein
VSKESKFEVYRGKDGLYRGRLMENGTVVRFPVNGLPKDLGAEERQLIEKNVQAAMEVLFAQNSSYVTGKTAKNAKGGKKAAVRSRRAVTSANLSPSV